MVIWGCASNFRPIFLENNFFVCVRVLGNVAATVVWRRDGSMPLSLPLPSLARIRHLFCLEVTVSKFV